MTMHRVLTFGFLYVANLVLLYECARSYENIETEEIQAMQCSEEYENCGAQYVKYNITDSMIINATTNEHYDEGYGRTVKVNGFCCPGLVCKSEGYEEEPVAPGVTRFCADPDNDLNRERMFDEWKKSLEMPPNYSN